ncbi:hypothetical protein V2J09_020916 [Rumex salicifolius]
MESEESGEPDKKRLHSSNISSPMARNSTASPENKSVDATVLQYQNQRLVQQLEKQKHELHDLEAKIEELKEKQSSYDAVLIKINQLWNELDDDLLLLGKRAGGTQLPLQILDIDNHLQGSGLSCAPEDMFLCRLLKVNSIETNEGNEALSFIEDALAHRQSSTMELMELLDVTIKAQRAKTESIAHSLQGNPSTEDTVTQLSTIDSLMEEELKVLGEWFNLLRQKHDDYTEAIQNYIHKHSEDQAELKHVEGELEEAVAELEESRRKLVNLKMQKKAASETYNPSPGAMNGNIPPEKISDKSMGLQELKESVEEAQIVSEDRLSELEDAREDNMILSKQLEDLQKEIKDDKFVYSCRLFTLLKDQLHHWKVEVERYKALTDSLQADRPNLLRREKELENKVESVDNLRTGICNTETRVEELELKLQNCRREKNDLEIKMEESVQDLGRKDIKEEFRVMASALSKEMEMMKAQLNRWKDTAHEALSLNEEAQSLNGLLGRKTGEIKGLQEKYAQQMKENLELEIFVNMYGQGIYDERSLAEIEESKQRANSQAEALKHALNEHGLELRVRAAHEAEVACQQRLSAAEAEIADLRNKLDSTERSVQEIREAIKIKDIEAEAYISEIETIGQAYEDMQAQNQRLLQQMTERDDYNIKLVSESVKTKQSQNTLLSEKETLSKQLQQVKASLESLVARISRGEEQMKFLISEAVSSTQQDRHLAVSLEFVKWELADTEKELKWIKSAIASSEKEHDQVRIMNEEIQSELDTERNERLKLEEEIAEWRGKVDEMSSQTGEAAIQRLQEEIKESKAVLKCGVCFDRPKEVVIVKCFHLFCNRCIQRNLEIRHRKCPGCGTAFGQNDVRFVKI